MNEHLFDATEYEVPALPTGPDVTGLGHDAARTARQKWRIENGIHPVMKTVIPNGTNTCGDCAHLILKNRGFRMKWWKCTRLLRDGMGPDMRKWWPACSLFTPKEDQ